MTTKASPPSAHVVRDRLVAPLVVEEARALPVVSLAISLRQGSVLDPAGKEGLLRATLRMLRRGASGMTATEIEGALDRLGAEVSIDVASSSATLHAQVLRRNLDAFVDLLVKLLHTPTFDAEEFGRLRRETIAEIIESKDNDRAVAQRAFRRTLFQGHPHGRRATRASIEHLEREDLRPAFERSLRPEDMVLGFAGHISLEEAVRIGEKILRGLPAGRTVAPPLPEPTLADGRRLVFVDKPERTQSQILMGGLGTSARDDDHFSLLLGNAVFGGTFTSRLMREVRSKRGWSYGASSRLGLDRVRQDFMMWTFPAAADTPPCIALQLELLETLVEKGITPRELSFIQKYLVRSFAFDMDTASKRLQQTLDVELLGLPEGYYRDFTKSVEAVTLAQVNDAIKKRISPENLLVVVLGTHSEIGEQVAAAIPRLVESKMVSFEED